MNGDGLTWETVVMTTANGAHSVFAADIDGDGRMDLAIVSSDDKIAWYRHDHACSCPIGRFGQSVCSPCPPGKYKPNVGSLCTDCEPGKYSGTFGQVLPCKDCQAGIHCSIGQTSENLCVLQQERTAVAVACALPALLESLIDFENK